MDILILGFSKIVRKRILPALLKSDYISGIDIASKSMNPDSIGSFDKKGKIFDDYEKALKQTKAKIVYISLVNSLHSQLCEIALNSGLHVIIDKPSFTDFKTALKLAKLAEKNNLCIAESTVYSYHPQVNAAKELFNKYQTYPKVLMANFSFPPLNKDNFRYSKELGGGAFLDLGPYAVSLGRIFFGKKPDAVNSYINTINEGKGVETSFSLLMTYSQGCSMIGHFSFESEYKNCLTIFGKELSVQIEPIFTIPDNKINKISVMHNNNLDIVEIPEADCFLIFLEDVIKGIEANNFQHFKDDLLYDAEVLHQLRSVSIGGR